MFRAYRLEPFEWKEGYARKGERLADALRGGLRACLSDFIINGEIDGTKLQTHWFPKTDASVFISHAREDTDLALSLAGWLKITFGINSFIDSMVWGHIDVLQKEIDNAYCKNEEEGSYDYLLRNKSTAHVHMMLATALSQMIDYCECSIFVSSPKSTNVEDAINRVHSSWIYHELNIMKLIRRRAPEDHRSLIKESQIRKSETPKRSLPIHYETDLSSFPVINLNTLKQWMSQWSEVKPRLHSHPLDALYDLTHSED